MRRFLFYDCEIIKCIPNKGKKLPGFKYCKGWEDFEGMGISVIGALDTGAGRDWAFVPQEFYDNLSFENALDALLVQPFSNFSKLVNVVDEVVGFNSKKFDDQLCKANGINITTTFDLLEEIRIKAYGSPRWEDCPKGHTYALGALGEANGFPKTGSGELAPQLWQQKRYLEVVRYCLNDVRITCELFLLFQEGKLKDPNTGKFL